MGFPYRGKCLYWEAVANAETAMDQSRIHPELVKALWGFAACTHSPINSPRGLPQCWQFRTELVGVRSLQPDSDQPVLPPPG